VVPSSLRGGEANKPTAVQIQASIAGLLMEQATFADAQRAFGPAEVRHNLGDAAGSACFACYAGQDGTTLVLAAHSEQGRGAITSFQLLRSRALADFAVYDYRPPAHAVPKCATTPRLTKTVATGGGLRLGMTRNEAVRLLGRERERSTSSELSFVLPDEERPVRDEDGTIFGYPSAWISVTMSEGRVVAIRVTYSSMV
jgi:hypothetical protein